MSWAPRADTALMTGTYDTSETAGPDARYGHVEQVTAAFDAARAVDLSRVAAELQGTSRDLPVPGQPPALRPPPEAERHRREALIAAQRALAQLRARGLGIDPASGQVKRLAPAQAPPGAGMGTMMTTDGES